MQVRRRDLIEKLARRAAATPSAVALRGMNLPVVLDALERTHRAARERHRGTPALAAHEAEVVDGLERNGVFVTHIDALTPRNAERADIVHEGRHLARTLAARVAAMQGRRPIMITTQPGDLVAQPAIYRWGLDASLLRIAGAYLGLPVGYDGPLLFHTPADGAEAGTRMWHIDREDRRVIKLALYLHDVDETGGPFQIFGREITRAGGYAYPPLDAAGLRCRFGASEDSEHVTTCTGPAGTLVFAETARFYHRGKPATHRPRSALFFTYFATPPRHPFYCGRTGLMRRQIVALAEGLSDEQRAAALWRDAVPWLWRAVPNHPL
jgi:hypothetical protein